jgi:hypothetical protein
MFDFTHAALKNPAPAPQAGSGGCSELVLSVDKPTYAAGESISISFANAPGVNPKDKIAVYTYPASGATLPSAEATLLVAYVGGGAVPTVAPVSGTVTLDESRVPEGKSWPLSPGGYIAYYLPNDGYSAIASVDFTSTESHCGMCWS